MSVYSNQEKGYTNIKNSYMILRNRWWSCTPMLHPAERLWFECEM